MSRNRHEISPGMRVVDADDHELGRVDVIDGTFFKIRPPFGAVIQIPLAAIQNVLGETVLLSLTKDQILGPAGQPPGQAAAGHQ